MGEIKRALWERDALLAQDESLEQKTVFQEELVHIQARRDGEYKQTIDLDDGLPLKNLIGLAFSGGGIRSATFGLGILEALKDHNLLKKIDYLSTVSGGGYIGAWLSANCKRAVECDIRVYLVDDENNKQELIKQFQTEFTSKPNSYALLIIAVETDTSINWTIAGFDDEKRFKKVPVDDNDLLSEFENIQLQSFDDLDNKLLNTLKKALPKNSKIQSIDLNNEEFNKPKIIKLASSSLKRSPPSEWLNKETEWGKSIDHLRRNSNYLSPKVGFFSADMWTMATVWFRNTLLIQILIILAIASLLILPRPLFILFNEFFKPDLHWGMSIAWHWGTIALYILVVVSIASNLLRINRPESEYLTVNKWKVKLFGAVFCLFFAWVIATDNNYDFINPNAPVFFSFCTKLSITILLVLAGFFILPTLAKLKNLIWSEDKDLIKQINYTQKDVQSYVILPTLVFSLLLSGVLQQIALNDESLGSKTFEDIFFYSMDEWPISILVMFISLWLLSVCSVRGYDSTQTDDKIRHLKKSFFVSFLLAPVVTATVLQASLSGILLFLVANCDFGIYEQWMFFVWTAPLLLFAFSLVVVVLIGMVGRESSDAVREWWGRYSAWLAIYGFCWMMLVIIAIYGPWLSAMLLDNNDMWGNGISLAWVSTTLAGFFASKSSKQNSSSKLKEAIAKVAPFVFIVGLLLIISTVLHLIIVSNSAIDEVILSANYFRYAHWYILYNVNIEVILVVYAMCLGGVLLLAFRVDINEFSLNAFYRSRLVRCYLGATRFRKSERHPQYFTGFDEDDDLKMAELIDSSKKQPPTGLFHIVNCALNLGGSSDLSLHTRHSAIFTLTPLRCGSSFKSEDHLGCKGGGEREIGYISTDLYGGKENQPTLGQAVSISGAAASPNMGYHTSPVKAFLMTLFNARLGWWFPNPDKPSVERPSPNFSLFYLARELLGVANEKSEFLAISDGGHFENLAAYELIKRKCKVIIVSDGECDPLLQFEGLGRLIRMCEVDLDAKINIDVTAIQAENNSFWSQNRYAIGQIEYSEKIKPEGPKTGWLIYLKASMNGDENTAIKQYKATHPTFPHETAADQFYGEDQFESYRKLGRGIAENVFASVSSDENLASLAEKLYFHDLKKLDQECSK